LVSSSGDGRVPPPGVKPGALTDLLMQVAAVPETPEAEPAPLQPGAVVGRFEIVRELGRGGFGVVYEARDRELGRQVALKLVRSGAGAAEDGKVTREAEAIARLAHPNLITLHDVGRSEHGPYLVFELLRGKTLQERIDDGPLPLQEAVHIAVEVARGLAHAHAEGVVHRDLKPSNVFVTVKGQVKILDFGMAHAFGRRRLSGGTPAYMAPEQWTDEPEDERTDVFALGVMLHVMLSGEYPFPENGGRWSAGTTTAPKLDLPGAPGLADLIDRMLEKAAKGRPRDGAAVLAALTPIQDSLRTRPADSSPPSHAKRRKATLGERFSSPVGRRLLGWVAAVTTGAMLAVGGSVVWKRFSGARATAETGVTPSIAVLPFADLSERQDQGYLADGIAEELLGVLSKVQGLRVPGRTSSFHFKGKQARLEEVGQELQVEHVLEGSVRSSGKRLRINAELVRISNGERVWTETFEREFTDVFAIQDEIARAVVAALRVRLMPGQEPVAKAYRTDNQEAYESYLLGKQFLKSQSYDSMKRALAALEKSVQLAPRFAPAWAYLSGARMNALDLGLIETPWSEGRREALDAANHAVELAPDLPEALAVRALFRMTEWDWAGAKSDIDRAKQLAPDDPATLGAKAVYAAWTGRKEEALTLGRLTVALDPLDGGAWNSLGILLTNAEHFEEAERAFARAMEVDPHSHFVHGNRMFLMVSTGRFAEALALCPKIDPAVLCEAIVHHELGNTARSQKALEVVVADARGGQDFLNIGFVQAIRGEKDSAFEWLEKARARHVGDLSILVTGLAFRSLHADPRWAALLRKMNLSPGGEPLPATAAAAEATPSIAVLPFADMSEKRDQEYFADGVAEEILNALAQVKGLKVIGRTSSFSFKGKKEDLRSIGQQLGAGTLLEGSVRKQGSMLRITAQLIKATDGTHLWSQVFDRNEAKIFAVQEEIARAVVTALQLKLRPGEDLQSGWMKTDAPEAYYQFLLGREFDRRGTLEGYRRALGAYEKALAIDPRYGPAWDGLVQSAIVILGVEGDEPKLRKRALFAADQAIAVAPNLPNGYLARSRARRAILFDWAGALAEVDKALTLRPEQSDALERRAELVGSPESRAESVRRYQAMADGDPLNTSAWNDLGFAQMEAGDFVNARRSLERALEIAPGNPNATWSLCLCLIAGGQAKEALALVAHASLEWERLSCTALAQNDLGKGDASKAALEALIARHADISAYQVAEIHARRGENDRAFEWLDRAFVQHDQGLFQLRFDPLLLKLHSDPRWKPFLKKMSVP
jgi:serine/threonine-protein kinase